MKIVRTKDGRTLYKGDDGRWFKHADFKTGKFDFNFKEMPHKNGSVDVYDGDEFLGNAVDSEEIKELKEERKKQQSNNEAEIAKIRDNLTWMKRSLEDPNVDQWAKKSMRKKIPELEAKLKALKGAGK